MIDGPGIYEIVHVETGRRYVGQATNIGRRWRDHRCDLKHGRHTSLHLQRAWLKYGPDAFAFKVIEVCSVEHLDAREQAQLDLGADFNVLKLARSPRGVVRSEETKRRIADALRGKAKSAEHRANIARAGRGKRQSAESRAKKSAALMGRVFTAEHRAKISAANKGRRLSPETRAKISAARRGVCL